MMRSDWPSMQPLRASYAGTVKAKFSYPDQRTLPEKKTADLDDRQLCVLRGEAER
jgi:hypothetical protein